MENHPGVSAGGGAWSDPRNQRISKVPLRGLCVKTRKMLDHTMLVYLQPVFRRGVPPVPEMWLDDQLLGLNCNVAALVDSVNTA